MLALESPPGSNSIACSTKVQVHKDVYSIGTVLLTIFLLMVLMNDVVAGASDDDDDDDGQMLKITMWMMVTMMCSRVWLAWREPPAACHCFFTTWEAAADETTQSRDTSQCEIDKVYLHKAREAICHHLNHISENCC